MSLTFTIGVGIASFIYETCVISKNKKTVEKNKNSETKISNNNIFDEKLNNINQRLPCVRVLLQELGNLSQVINKENRDEYANYLIKICNVSNHFINLFEKNKKETNWLKYRKVQFIGLKVNKIIQDCIKFFIKYDYINVTLKKFSNEAMSEIEQHVIFIRNQIV